MIYGNTMKKLIVILGLLMLSSYSFANKEFDPLNLKCKKSGQKKSVWINTSHGTYALNGQATTWFNRTKELDVPLLGTDGKEWKIGRDHIDPSDLQDLIKEGLKLCS